MTPLGKGTLVFLDEEDVCLKLSAPASGGFLRPPLLRCLSPLLDSLLADMHLPSRIIGGGALNGAEVPRVTSGENHAKVEGWHTRWRSCATALLRHLN
jgi:hypothetical protein